jgi:uncharacterized Zn-finger protein
MSSVQPSTKCGACNRVIATHAAGCSLVSCPNRHPEVWCPTEGAQGLAGSMAEERIQRRRRERNLAVEIGMEDLK